MSSSGTVINMVTNTNNNLHKVHHHHHHYKQSSSTGHKTSSNSISSTSSQEGSASSAAIYIAIDDTEDNINSNNISHSHSLLPNNIQHNDANKSLLNESVSNTNTKSNELSDINHNNTNNKQQPHLYRKHHNHSKSYAQQHHNHHYHQSSLFGHDYIRNFVILSKLYSPQEYYANIQITQLPFLATKKHKYRGSDCPSDISSLDSRRRKRSKSKQNKWRKLISWMKYMNSTLCEIFKFLFDALIFWCNKFQKWQKELHEAPLEVKEKYFFIVSTIISTILFYILFICLDIMIKHWFALPSFITEYSFSLSYCISYLTSVIWQHFFNQYFVFTITRYTNNTNTDSDAFCDSLFRTYLVYGCSLMITGIIGSLLQIYAGIADEFILFLTLPLSGIMNYYLLRYCHNKQQHQYQLIPNNDNKSKKYHHHHHHQRDKTRHATSSKHIFHKNKINKLNKNNIKHHNKHTADDIVIV